MEWTMEWMMEYLCTAHGTISCSSFVPFHRLPDLRIKSLLYHYRMCLLKRFFSSIALLGSTEWLFTH